MSTTTHAIDHELYHELRDIEREIRNTNYLDFFRESALPNILAGEEAMFREQHDPEGAPWAALSQVTIDRKGHSQILFETGALEKSLIEVGAEGNITQINERQLVFGTSIDYASPLFDGTARMPARPMVGVSEDQVDQIADDLAEFLVARFVSGGEPEQ